METLPSLQLRLKCWFFCGFDNSPCLWASEISSFKEECLEFYEMHGGSRSSLQILSLFCNVKRKYFFTFLIFSTRVSSKYSFTPLSFFKEIKGVQSNCKPTPSKDPGDFFSWDVNGQCCIGKPVEEVKAELLEAADQSFSPTFSTRSGYREFCWQRPPSTLGKRTCNSVHFSKIKSEGAF